MSTMQLFYNRLNQPAEARGQHLQTLAQVTRASAADLADLQTASDWVSWTSANP
jgi:hypothetical protein